MNDSSLNSNTRGDKKKTNYYELLGVEKNATEKQIAQAYRKLALKFHPDRNQGSEEAAETFKEISTAYAVLSDPNRRRQYDVSGSDETQGGLESVDMESLGNMGRMFGAVISKLGIPIPTQISQSTLARAFELCKSRDGQPRSEGVWQMEYGVEYTGVVERQQSRFFWIHIPQEILQQGLILRCTSSNKSRFKLVIFDSNGAVRYQEESEKSGKHLTASYMYFTPFETSCLKAPFPMLGTDIDTPPIFNRLENFISSKRDIESGDHLICVYGDNWLKSINFALTAIPVKSDNDTVSAILNADEAVRLKKETLVQFQEEYTKAKEQYEAAMKRLEEHNLTTQQLIQARDEIYERFEKLSIERSFPEKGLVEMNTNEKKKNNFFGFKV